MNQGLGIRDQGSGIRDQGSGIRDQGSGIQSQGLASPSLFELVETRIPTLNYVFYNQFIIHSTPNSVLYTS